MALSVLLHGISTAPLAKAYARLAANMGECEENMPAVEIPLCQGQIDKPQIKGRNMNKTALIEWDKLLNNSEVLLMAADGSRRVNLNESGYYDSQPKWANGGSQMLWFSNRDGLRSYATSGRYEQDVYSMFFTQTAWDTFNLSDVFPRDVGPTGDIDIHCAGDDAKERDDNRDRSGLTKLRNNNHRE